MTSVLITTLNLSAVYALVGIGVSLTWAGLGFLNLAHGTTYAGAAYGAWWASVHVSGNAFVVLAGGLLTGALLGLLLYFIVFLPLDGRRNFELRTMIATLAIALAGENILLRQWGAESKTFPAIFDSLPEISIGEQNMTSEQVGALISATIIVVILVLLLEGSRIGLGVRALTQNVEGAKLVGINRRTAAIAILAVSGALVGVAAVLLGPVYFVSPFVGFQPMIKGLTVAMLGGLGSIRGTVIAAVLVAFAEAATAVYIGPEFVLVTLFVLLAVVLLVRPRGIAGVLETSRA
jgi:branched-chain amino acid transport system permease protein